MTTGQESEVLVSEIGMSDRLLLDARWYSDPAADRGNEPGIRHSFMACLATALNHINGNIDPVWLMGASTFAFRIVVAENLCPSAMSIFDWGVLRKAVHNIGHECTYIDRLWHEGEKEVERRNQAHEAIVTNLREGRPAIVWDVFDSEWGLIYGYDGGRAYLAYSNVGRAVTLQIDKLGRNGIDILSVTIPGEKNGRSRDESIHVALTAAVNHAAETEWMDRPRYRDGLGAYELWATVYDRGALIAEAGRGGNVPEDVFNFARYYAEHYCSARRYARDFLRSIAEADPDIEKASECYSDVADALELVRRRATDMKAIDDPDVMRDIAALIRQAGSAERRGIEFISRNLSKERS